MSAKPPIILFLLIFKYFPAVFLCTFHNSFVYVVNHFLVPLRPLIPRFNKALDPDDNFIILLKLRITTQALSKVLRMVYCYWLNANFPRPWILIFFSFFRGGGVFYSYNNKIRLSTIYLNMRVNFYRCHLWWV